MRSLWTKFTSAALMLAVVATSVASAASMPGQTYIRNVAINADSIDPSRGETASITFSVVQSATVSILAENPSNGQRFWVTQDMPVTAGQERTFTFRGTTNNSNFGTPLPSADYDLYVMVPSTQPGVFAQTYALDIEIVNNPVVDAPEITNFSVNPSSFKPDQGQQTTASFSVDQTAQLTVRVETTGGSLVRSYNNYNGDNYSAQNHSVVWDGRNNSGSVVSNGTYNVEVRAVNADGLSDTETRSVTVSRNATGSAPNINNLVVTPSPFDPQDGENTNINFSVDKTSDISVSISNSAGVVRSFSSYSYNSYPAQNHSVSWNGRNNSNVLMPEGTYTVEVRAKNSFGTDRETYNVVIENDNGGGSNAPQITNLRVVPTTFDPNDGESTSIRFDVDQTANLTVEVQETGAPGFVYRSFSNYNGDLYSAGAQQLTWNGRANTNVVVPEGTYEVTVRATNSNGSDYEEVLVTVDKDGVTGSDLIINLELNPSDEWDPTDEDLEIDFELTEDVDDLEIYARRGSKEIEILDDRNVDEDDYTETWDGTDEDDDYIDEGVWTIYVEADGEVVSEQITVEYEAPEFIDAFVTKDEFDPELDEFTHLVFKLEEDAVVTVEVYEGNSRRITLLDEDDVEGDEWITVMYDGKDDDGDEEDYGNDYEFRITAEHPAVDNLEAEETVDFDLDEDEVSNDRSNATNDYFDPVVFDVDDDGRITIHYCIDEDAGVSLDIFKGRSASGSVQATLLDEDDQNEGCHTLSWAGDDEDGDELNDGVYSYELVTRTSGSRKDTETGRFVIGDGDNGGTGPGPGPQPPTGGDCGGYWDTVNLNGELCAAIEWVTNEGIFHGNPDGSFRPYNNINRAEVLKVVLEAFQDYVTMLPADGSTLGFRDVNPSEWYMTYARTAKFYGMLHGYLNSTEARFYNPINRVEFLKFALEASDAFTNWETPGYENSYYGDVNPNEPTHDWFFDYAGVAHEYGLYNTYYNATNGMTDLRPGDMVQRGEVALLLYRMNNAGLL